MAHLPPSHEWKSISPCVVLAEKFGATLPSLNRGCSSVAVASRRQRKGDMEEGETRKEKLKAFHDRGAGRVKKFAIVEGYVALKPNGTGQS